jgi:hypothetical protein
MTATLSPSASVVVPDGCQPAQAARAVAAGVCGADPAEAAVAARKLEQIQGRRAKAEEILRDLNWSPEQATGIVSCFDALPAWRGDVMRQWRGGNLCGWSARKQFDPLDVSAQMRFCSHDLRTTMMQMGAAINEAKTANEAADLFSGYAEKVSRISHE